MHGNYDEIYWLVLFNSRRIYITLCVRVNRYGEPPTSECVCVTCVVKKRTIVFRCVFTKSEHRTSTLHTPTTSDTEGSHCWTADVYQYVWNQCGHVTISTGVNHVLGNCMLWIAGLAKHCKNIPQVNLWYRAAATAAAAARNVSWNVDLWQHKTSYTYTTYKGLPVPTYLGQRLLVPNNNQNMYICNILSPNQVQSIPELDVCNLNDQTKYFQSSARKQLQ